MPRLRTPTTGISRPSEKDTMAISVKRTSQAHANGVKLVVYGQSGAGKTTLIKTLPSPVIISAEAGLLSLVGEDLPYVEVSTMAELHDAYRWVAESAEAREFESVAVDSISEIGEVVLAHEKRANKDGRAAYGEMGVQMMELLRAFRDLSGKHVFMSAKCEKAQDEQGRMLYSPSMPGNKLAQAIPYLVDEVLALRVEKDAEGIPQRALMCAPDGLWTAKDRSGRLDAWEAPDLGAVIRKIAGGAS